MEWCCPEKVFSGGGGGLFVKRGLEGSEIAGSVSDREYPVDGGCNVLGDEFLSAPNCSNGRGGPDEANGDGSV